MKIFRTQSLSSFVLLRWCVGLLVACFLVERSLDAQQTIPPIERRLPPLGIELPQETWAVLDAGLKQLRARIEKLNDHGLRPDIEIYAKAVDYALLHREFYSEKEIPLAVNAIQTANGRLDQLAAGKPDWLRQNGLVVRGYRSAIDGSVQPFGLEIPEDIDWEKPAPLYVWLHGRGDNATDIHFIAQRQSKAGQIHPAGAIVLHPFGRHCVGFKSAGEIDVLEAIKQVQSQYNIDADRIVLMGFSMGGAGAWHLGAHYPHLWCAVAPGAGFAETAEYNNLKPADYPEYVQKLWTLYDVPNYALNLMNMPLVAYSGENDKQMQAALVMERALADDDFKLTHIIGPGMGHQYHPDSLREIMRRMAVAEKQGRPHDAELFRLQTRTLRYNQAPGIEVLGLEEHWQDSRVAVRRMDNRDLAVGTKNVTALRLPLWESKKGAAIEIDGQKLTVDVNDLRSQSAVLVKANGKWAWREARDDDNALRKRPKLQGPIDDAFMAPFLLVMPSGRSKHSQVQRWVEFESTHFQDRWRALMRGELRMKKDVDVTAQDAKDFHLVLWGDVDSNSYIKRVLAKLPIGWDENDLQVNGKSYDSATHVPLLVYPNPENSLRYVVFNSGLTFREANDRTNSLQNPQLPDWAVIDLSELPNDRTPGKVIAADFFDEQWKFKAGQD